MGEVLYGSYDRDALDVQYNNRERVSDYMDYFDKWKSTSEKTRRQLDCRINVPFGDSAAETIDIFPAAEAGAPVCMFIHGGYWQSLDKADFSFLAEGLVPNGVTLVVNNYGLCPHVTMDEITTQNRAAIQWIWTHAADIGVDPNRIHVSGHSAGGHLVGMLMATDWPALGDGAPADLIKSGCAISGLYDMEPIRLCYLNAVLCMGADMSARNTPLTLDYPVRTPMLITHGGLESDEYHRQTREMTALWERLDYPVECVIGEGLNHFSLVDEFARPDSDLTRRQLSLIL